MTERFFLNQKIKDEQKEVLVFDVGCIFQITKVLRKKKEDRIVILDNTGFEYECQIRQANKKLLLLDVLKKCKNENEPEIEVVLYQSIIKKNKIEFVFEKCTEVGVSAFCPILSEHSVKLSFNKKRAETILKEAAEQSQRGKIPELFDVLAFKKAIKKCEQNSALNLIFHNFGENENLHNFILKNKEFQKVKKINIFVGPEGGFSENEINFAKENGFFVLSLGKRTLKAETAAVVSSAFLLLDK